MTAERREGRQDFNPALNGYRGFCALLVFCYHLGSAGVIALPHGSPLADAAAELWISLAYGVEMFFMISGFVILGSLLRHATLRGFLEDRLIRIYTAWVPALTAVTAVCLLLSMKMFAGASPARAAGIYLANLFLLPPLLPFPLVHQGSWSLSYEWVFYLSAVSGAWLLRRRNPRPWAVGIWGLGCVTFVALYPRSVFFLTGVLVFARESWFRRHEQWLKWPLLSLPVFLIAWRCTGADRSSLADTLFTWVQDGRSLAAVIAFLAAVHLFACITLNASRAFAFLRSRTFQFLGTISYSFYLWHALVMSATKRIALAYLVPRHGVAVGFLFFLLSSLALGVLIAWASWSLFEVRLARFLRKSLAHRKSLANGRPSVDSPTPAPSTPLGAAPLAAVPLAAVPLGAAALTAVPRLVPPRAPAPLTLAPAWTAPPTTGRRLRCLWVARYLPYPLDAGAKVYSAKLAEALAEAGATVRFLGFGDVSLARAATRTARLEWRAVPGAKRRRTAAALSALPVAAAIDATPAYRALLDEQLEERWDAIILDGYGSGWALARCLAYRSESAHPPALVHVSHNHEATLWQSMAAHSHAHPLARLALRRNARKVGTLERGLLRHVDLLTTITEEDRRTLGASFEAGRVLTLTPGYEGWSATERRITDATPRRVILMGSFQWVAKRENLERFVEIADPAFHEHGITLEVIGEVPAELRSRLEAHCRATRFHGFIADPSPFFAKARLGVVPESIGGGFKLKFLDYLFGRLPVATLTHAAAGLPPELQSTFLKGETLEALVRTIVSHIDRTEDLDRRQEQALALARERYRWTTRGEELHRAIERTVRGEPMFDAERIARERDYHNQRFADDSEREARVGRFYAAIRYGFDLYRSRVAEAARLRRVLEYGCGTGSLAFDLTADAHEVVGIDISEVAIERARREVSRRRIENARFLVDNAEAMHLPDQHVDVVVGSGIIHHLDIPKAMAEVRRVLKPGGIALFAEPLAHNPALAWYRRRTPELRSADEHPLTIADLNAMTRGFSAAKITYFGLLAPALGLVSRDPKPRAAITRLAWSLDRLLCRIPGLNRYAWYCLIELQHG